MKSEGPRVVTEGSHKHPWADSTDSTCPCGQPAAPEKRVCDGCHEQQKRWTANRQAAAARLARLESGVRDPLFPGVSA